MLENDRFCLSRQPTARRVSSWCPNSVVGHNRALLPRVRPVARKRKRTSSHSPRGRLHTAHGVATAKTMTMLLFTTIMACPSHQREVGRRRSRPSKARCPVRARFGSVSARQNTRQVYIISLQFTKRTNTAYSVSAQFENRPGRFAAVSRVRPTDWPYFSIVGSRTQTVLLRVHISHIGRFRLVDQTARQDVLVLHQFHRLHHSIALTGK